MKKSKWVMVPILAMFIMGVISAAQAEDFTITVPLRLNNLHAQVESVRVFCQALNASGALVGGWNTVVPVGPTGSVSQNVVVAFNAEPNQVASNATQYRCWFDLKAKGDQMFFKPNEGNTIMYKAKPGTALVPLVSGAIPKDTSATMSVPKTAPRAAPIAPR
jgi:hypothetical protein